MISFNTFSLNPLFTYSIRQSSVFLESALVCRSSRFLWNTDHTCQSSIFLHVSFLCLNIVYLESVKTGFIWDSVSFGLIWQADAKTNSITYMWMNLRFIHSDQFITLQNTSEWEFCRTYFSLFPPAIWACYRQTVKSRWSDNSFT